MNYQKRKYRRHFTTGPETGQQTVSFELMAVVHTVKLTETEAAVLNRGKLETHSNVFFEMLIPEGGEDPQPVTTTDSKAGPGGPVDVKGKLIGSNNRRVPVTGGGNDHRPRGRSGF